MNHNRYNQKKSEYIIKPIAHIETDYNEKFGIPRQCGLVTGLEQAIVFEPEFDNIDGVRGIEGYSYLWLIWGFTETEIDMSAKPIRWSPLVRPPRLGGNIKKGVWSSRSPYRPNSLGLSNVKLIRVENNGDDENTSSDSQGKGQGRGKANINARGLRLIVEGADLLNGTPIFDIKPYIPYSDSRPEAKAGFSEGLKDECLDIDFPENLLSMIDEDKRDGLLKVLELDPRGAYEKKDGHVYGLSFANWDIRFSVNGNQLSVIDVLETEHEGSIRESEIRRIK